MCVCVCVCVFVCVYLCVCVCGVGARFSCNIIFGCYLVQTLVLLILYFTLQSDVLLTQPVDIIFRYYILEHLISMSVLRPYFLL